MPWWSFALSWGWLVDRPSRTLPCDAHPVRAAQVITQLGHRPKRGEVYDLIWEVDEDCNGTIDWPEFTRMYQRARQVRAQLGRCSAAQQQRRAR